MPSVDDIFGAQPDPPGRLLAVSLFRVAAVGGLVLVALLVGSAVLAGEDAGAWMLRSAMTQAAPIAFVGVGFSAVLERLAKGRGWGAGLVAFGLQVALLLLALGVGAALGEWHHGPALAVQEVITHTRPSVVAVLALPAMALGLATLVRTGHVRRLPSPLWVLPAVALALGALMLAAGGQRWPLLPAIVVLQFPVLMAVLGAWAAVDRATSDTVVPASVGPVDPSALTTLDRVLTTKGGVWILVFAAVIGGGLLWSGVSPQVGVLVPVAAILVWSVVAANWPEILLRRGLAERALAAVRSQRRSKLDSPGAQGLALSRELRALVALARHDELRVLLHDFQAQVDTGWRGRQQRLLTANKLVAEGLAAEAAELLVAIPSADRTGTVGKAVICTLAAALIGDERPDEALAILDGDAFEGTKGRLRAVMLNNRAVGLLEARGDTQQALAHAREAVALAPRLGLLNGSLGACMVACGEDPRAALERLERARPQLGTWERNVLWQDYWRGRALQALGREEEGLPLIRAAANSSYSRLAGLAQQTLADPAATPGAGDP